MAAADTSEKAELIESTGLAKATETAAADTSEKAALKLSVCAGAGSDEIGVQASKEKADVKKSIKLCPPA